MIIVYGNWLLCIRGFESGEIEKERDISTKGEGFAF